MTTAIVTERSILPAVTAAVATATRRLWVTAPWATSGAVDLVFGPVMARLAAGEDLDVRIVYRLKGADDLTISDLAALDRLAAAGCAIRYSNRLHAKTVIVDDTEAVVSSSNLTATAGYSTQSGPWQNEELGVHLTAAPDLVADLAAEFNSIWVSAHELSERTVGLSLDGASASSFRVACMRAPVVGEFVVVGLPARAVGQVVAVSAHNPTVPAVEGDTDTLLGLRGGEGGQRSQAPGVETLFSHPSKTHAYLMAQTFVRASATYHLAEVTVIRSVTPDGAFAPSVGAVEPGEVVTTSPDELLDRLISGTDGTRLEIGHLPANPTVRVSLDTDRLLTLHTAVLGMTGAGKSNAVRVLIERLRAAVGDLRVVIVDTHGEYHDLDAGATTIGVRFLPCVLDEAWVKRASHAGRQLNEVMDTVTAVLDDLGEDADLAVLAAALRAAPATAGLRTRLDRLADAVTATPNLCLDLQAATVIETRPDARPVDWTRPGLYVLDLLGVDGAAERIRQTGAVAEQLLRWSKQTNGAHPALLVVDEAQNYVPEQQTGRLGAARPSFEPLFEIATEGRKFHCGLLVASQRPARVNKDILSQCNTQLILRMVSVEDLAAVADCFEQASSQLLHDLPQFATGTCYAGGAALAMGTQIALPRWEP